MGPRKFTREFKLGAVKLVNEQGRSIMQVSKDLGIDRKNLRAWIKKFTADPGSGSREAMTDELQRLRKENKRLLMERDILKKATAFFASQQT
jgi:transposase